MLALPTLALVETEPELRRRLFDDYNPVQRPSVAMAQSCGEVEVPPDRVQVQFSTSRIHSISSVDESYGIDGYLRIYWNDPRLRFNSTAEGGCIDKLSLGDPVGQIWVPDVYFENSIGPSSSDRTGGNDLGELSWVYSDGSVTWSRRARLRFSCPMQFDSLPFDKQCCDLRIGSYSFVAEEVDLGWRDDGEDGVSNWADQGTTDWDVIGMLFRNKTYDYTTSQGSTSRYAYAEAILVFERNPAWYLAFARYSVFFVVLGYCGFYIDSTQTSARVSLGLLTITIVFAMMNAVRQAAPKGAFEGTWQSEFMFVCMCFNLCGFGCQVLENFGAQTDRWLHSNDYLSNASNKVADEETFEGTRRRSSVQKANTFRGSLTHERVAKALCCASAITLHRWVALLRHVDVLLRWVYPIAFGIFLLAFIYSDEYSQAEPYCAFVE